MNEILIVIFTGVVAVSTVFYVVLTCRLVSETRTMRKAQTEPRVSVRVELDHDGRHGFELVVRNEGQGPAKNVKVKFDGGPNIFAESNLSGPRPEINQLPVIKDGIPYMESGATFRYFLGMTSIEAFEVATASPWSFRAQYQNLAGECKCAAYRQDFSQFTGMLFDRNYMEQIAKHLDSIRKDIHRLTEGHAKVRVVTQTEEEFQKEHEEYLKQYEREMDNNANAKSDGSS